MSIASAIQNIIDARDAAFDAVGDKGVTVPVGSDLGDLADLIDAIQTGGGGGGSGLDYETGTYTPESNNAFPEISFSGSHTGAPFMLLVADTSPANTLPSTTSVVMFGVLHPTNLFGSGFPNSTSTIAHGIKISVYRSTTGGASSQNAIFTSQSGGQTTDLDYYLSSTGIKMYASAARYFLSGRNYKWIAVWAPVVEPPAS